MARLGEFQIIRRFFAPLSRAAPGAFNLTDDAASLALTHGHDLVVTKDAVVAGVHFLADDPADLVARKALRVNISDLAAKGARPVGFLMALALPEAIDDAWLETFAAGLAADVEEFRCPLLGGDTVATPGPLTICITALGEVSSGHMVRRAGALAGDLLCVSGTIGDAALGLDVMRGAHGHLDEAQRRFLIGRYRLPQPRLELGRREAARDSACLDISDGLCADVGHICEVSGVGAVIDAENVPLSDAARAVVRHSPDAIARILTGGDDYELAFAVPPANLHAAQALGREIGVGVSVVGRFVAGAGVRVLDGQGRPLALSSAGYSHR